MLEEAHRYVETNSIPEVYFIDQIPQNELPSLYAESSLFILPTRYEIFGMVLMEAMYFGSPVITYKAAGPLDVIENGKDGVIMDHFDVNEWVEGILGIFNQNCSAEMGYLGQKKMEEKYIWEEVANSYYERYISIIEDK